jgi:hypothetical protein
VGIDLVVTPQHCLSYEVGKDPANHVWSVFVVFQLASYFLGVIDQMMNRACCVLVETGLVTLIFYALLFEVVINLQNHDESSSVDVLVVVYFLVVTDLRMSCV